MTDSKASFRETRQIQGQLHRLFGRSSMIRTVCQWLAGRHRRRHRRRVPVVLQLSNVECGAACLAMILNYYGRQTRIADVRQLCDSGRSGLTARAMKMAAQQYGLRATAYTVEPHDFAHIPLPAIAHWNFDHFVVVERWSPGRVDIVDPSLGRRRLTAVEFDAAFTGVVLTLEPDAHFEPAVSTAQPPWRYYLKQLLLTPGIPRLLAQIVVASFTLQLLGLAMPLFTKLLIDDVLPFRITSVMSMLGLGVLILLLAQCITSYLRTALLIYLQARLDTQMMLHFFEHMLSLPFRFFQQRTSGDLLMRLSSNSVIRETVTSQTLSVVLDGTFVLVYLLLILFQAPRFGLLVLAIGLLQFGLLLATNQRIHTLMQRQLAAQADSQGYLVQALAGIATLKAAGAETRAFDHWSNLFYKQLNASLQREHLSAVVDTMLTSAQTFSMLLLLWVGAYEVLDGTMSLGTMLALNALAALFLRPLSSLISTGRQLQFVGAHLERMVDVIEAEPEQNRQAVTITPVLSGHLELKNISFRYDAQSPWVLEDISFSVAPGQKVALVGRTGSGKSTLAMLLIGLYSPDRGEILYDGLSLSHLEYRSLRRQVGVVMQEPVLFSSSLRQNIAFNDPALSLDQITAVARLAVIHDEIMQMPAGYETPLAENGGGLSGGQRQRLAIARALAHRPVILLLDEATSHLDVATEKLVDRNLNSLACTRIVIAHRLSTVQNADLILVLDHGRIVERGTHTTLLASQGHYANLIYNQLETHDGERISSLHGDNVRHTSPIGRE